MVAQADALHLSTIGPPDPAEQPGPDTWIAGLGSLPLLAQPGERWFYNTGASVLGVLLERAAGQPFADVLRTRLFEPLGMRDTGFWTPHTGRLASAFRSAPGGGLEVWDKPDGSVERAAGVLRRGRGPGLDRRRPARVLPDAAARRGSGAAGRPWSRR